MPRASSNAKSRKEAKYAYNYTPNPAELPIALLCTNYLFRLIGPSIKFPTAHESTFCVRIARGFQKSKMKQDVIFTALLYIRRVAHFHGPSLGPLDPQTIPLWFTFVAALNLAASVLMDGNPHLSMWIQAFPHIWDHPLEPIKDKPDELLKGGKVQLREAKELLCDALRWDLIPHSKQFFDPFKAALIAHFEGKSAADHIRDVTSRCIFYEGGLVERPDAASYECHCSLIEVSSADSGPSAVVDVDEWMAEDSALFPQQSAEERCTKKCGPRIYPSWDVSDPAVLKALEAILGDIEKCT